MKHKKGFKALAAAVLSVSLLIGLVPATVFADGTEVFRYVDKNGEDHALPDNAVVLESVPVEGLTGGWYVFTEDTVVNKRIDISGNVTLVLATQGNKQDQFQYGIHVPETASLTIYKAQNYSGYMNISAPGSCNAGIGGDTNKVNGKIIIESAGIINVNGGDFAAGIGTGAGADPNAQPGDIRIEAGVREMNITASQGGNAIGPGVVSPEGDIYIYDAAIIKVGSSNDDLKITYDVSDCAKNLKVSILKCTSHSGTDRYVSISDTQHVLLCDKCRTMVEMEDHDGSPCSKCGHSSEVVAYTVTFTDGTTQLGVAEVNSGETLSASSIPEVTPPEGKKLVGWKIEGTNDFFDIENDVVTGAITLVATFDEALLATIVESEVVFEGALKIAFGFHFTDELMALTGAKVVFKKGDEVVSSIALTDGYTRDGSDELFYDYDFMLPEYSEPITVFVLDADDQPILLRGAQSGTDYPNGVTYSASEYAGSMAGSHTASLEMRNLASAFLNYGGAARTYFSAPETATNSGDYETQLNNLEPYKLTITGTKPTGVTNVYINTFFEEDHTLRISFKLAEGKTKNDYTFQIDGENAKVYSLGDNKYAIEVNNIAAPNLADAHDFSISDGTATYTVKASALSYAYTSVKNGNTARKNLGVTMYDYFDAAHKFFEEKDKSV